MKNRTYQNQNTWSFPKENSYYLVTVIWGNYIY